MTTLPQTLFDEIERHGREAYPEECVGALIGTVAAGGAARTVERLFPIDNRSGENRKRRYLVSPLDYLAAERAADAAGKTLLGFYHSHPEHPAEPSATDLDLAQPNFVYLIVSIRRGYGGGPEQPQADASRQSGLPVPVPQAADAGAFVLDFQRAGFLTDELVIEPESHYTG